MTNGQARARLLARIRDRYEVKVEAVTLGGATFDFLRVADPDAVLDQVADEVDRRERKSGQRDKTGDTLHIPYWAALWDSAYAVAREVAGRTLTGQSVLDLGCGLGLTTCAAAVAGANVIAADLEPPALLFAQWNAWPWRHRVRTRQINWQTDTLGQKFDLIVGADILYERAQWPFLETFFQQHLNPRVAPRGEILLGEPGRQTGDLFLPHAQALGWSLTITHRESIGRDGTEREIRLISLTRGGV